MFENLDARILTGITTGVRVDERELPLTSRFGGLTVNRLGDVARWDEILPNRELVKAFEGRRATSTPTDPSGIRERAAGMLGSFKSRYAWPEELEALRAVGGSSSSDLMSAEQQRDMIVGDMNRRYVTEPMEFLIAGALQDNLSFTVDGRTVTPDYGLAGGHDLTAAVTWNTASTDIEADVETCKRLIEQDSGEIARFAWMGRNVAKYIRKNTVVQGWLQGYVGADARWEVLQGEQFEMFGLRWISSRRGALVSSTWTPYIPDDKVIFTPEPNLRWFQVQQGQVMYPSTIYGDFGDFNKTFGVATWARLKDEPPSIKFLMRWRRLPILVFPSAVVNLDTTP